MVERSRDTPTDRYEERVAIGLGSNSGDRSAHLSAAVRALGDQLSQLRCSRVYETAAAGKAAGQPRFLNMCCTGGADQPPDLLLQRMLEIEQHRGRTRGPGRGSTARTLDLDLLLYSDRVIDRPGIRVPHPRFRKRAFVLIPLAEVAGSWRDPVSGRTIAELAERVDASGVEPYGGDLPVVLEEAIDG